MFTVENRCIERMAIEYRSNYDLNGGKWLFVFDTGAEHLHRRGNDGIIRFKVSLQVIL